MCIDHIRSEDANTNHIDIGPVNKVINMLSIFWAEGPDSQNFKKHQERIKDYLWISHDGMKMQGYNGSQLWDTAFCLQVKKNPSNRNTNNLLINNFLKGDCGEWTF